MATIPDLDRISKRLSDLDQKLATLRGDTTSDNGRAIDTNRVATLQRQINDLQEQVVDRQRRESRELDSYANSMESTIRRLDTEIDNIQNRGSSGGGFLGL